MSVPLEVILLFLLAEEAPMWLILIGLVVFTLASPWIERRNRDELLSFSLAVVNFLLFGYSILLVVPLGTIGYCLKWVPFKFFKFFPMDSSEDYTPKSQEGKLESAVRLFFEILPVNERWTDAGNAGGMTENCVRTLLTPWMTSNKEKSWEHEVNQAMKNVFGEDVYVKREDTYRYRKNAKAKKHTVAIFHVKMKINMEASRGQFVATDEKVDGVYSFNIVNVRRGFTFSLGNLDFVIPVLSSLIAYTHSGILIRENSGSIQVIQLIRDSVTGRGRIVMAPLNQVLEECHRIDIGPLKFAIKMHYWTYTSFGEVDSTKIIFKLSSVLDQDSIYSIWANNCQHFVSAILDSDLVQFNQFRSGFETAFSFLLSLSFIVPSHHGVGCKAIAELELPAEQMVANDDGDEDGTAKE